MRIIYSWTLALFLSGCQLLQPATIQDQSTSSLSSDEPQVTESHQLPLAVRRQNQDDLWQRIAMQFEMPVPDEKTINYYRTWYQQHPNHLKVISERAAPFLYLITTKIEQRHLPLELALLPAVESAFDATAYSYSSAAGLWQFVPATGDVYGLTQDFWYDGRRDVAAATDAALDYLTALNKQFNGDWALAIAAYNSGGGRVARAIQHNQSLGKPTDFFSLDLPQETVNYLPKLLALADVIAHPEQYQLTLPPIPNQSAVELIDPQEQMDLSIAADYAGISLQQLQTLNPGYNQWVTAPEGAQQLLIPVDAVERFNHKVRENRGKGMKHLRYQVKAGDTVSVLAQTYHTTSQLIRTANKLSNDMIRIGQDLLIPTPANLNLTVEANTESRRKLAHTVQAGESLWTIAQKNHISTLALAQWNNMNPDDVLQIGQKLVIWQSSSS